MGDEAEERLFRAYLTEGKDFGDHPVLIELGKEIGLEESEITAALASDYFTGKVEQDIEEAAAIGINGVPFFVFDRKYAISRGSATRSVPLDPATVFSGMAG